MYTLTKERREETNKVQVGCANTPAHSVNVCVITYPCTCVLSQGTAAASVRVFSVCVYAFVVCVFVYEASPGQCRVPESSRTASVIIIFTHDVLAAHMTMPSPRTDNMESGSVENEKRMQLFHTQPN